MAVHPNSLANLRSGWTPDEAREAQKRGLEVRKANKAARDALKLSAKDWSKYKEEVLDQTEITALDTLKILMIKALDAEDFASATDIAKSLAEYERPKLARVDTKVEEVKADDLSDDELNEMLKKFT